MKTVKLVILALLVAGVWGKIAWELFAVNNTPDEIMPLTNFVPEQFVQKSATYALLEDYPDPFRMSKRKKSTQKVTPKKTNKAPSIVEKKTTPILWPSVVYNGFVNNQTKEIPTLFVVVNSTPLLMHEGDSIEGCRIERFFPDSLHLTQNNVKKTIPRSVR